MQIPEIPAQRKFVSAECSSLFLSKFMWTKSFNNFPLTPEIANNRKRLDYHIPGTQLTGLLNNF